MPFPLVIECMPRLGVWIKRHHRRFSHMFDHAISTTTHARVDAIAHIGLLRTFSSQHPQREHVSLCGDIFPRGIEIFLNLQIRNNRVSFIFFDMDAFWR